MIKKVIYYLPVLFLILPFPVLADEQLSLTTYVPAPSGVFKDLEVKNKLFIGSHDNREVSDFRQGGLSSKGSFHLQPRVTDSWDAAGLNLTPVEGQVIFTSLIEGDGGETTVKRKLWFYDGESYKEMISLPQLFADGLTIKIKVQTSLPQVYIGDKGPFGSSTDWVETTLYPGREDADRGGCNVYHVYRRCSMGSCSIGVRGSARGSPWVKVWTKVPDKSIFQLHCYSTGRCRTIYNCEWQDNTDSDKHQYKHIAYGYHYNNCGCIFCDCGVQPYTLDYY